MGLPPHPSRLRRATFPVRGRLSGDRKGRPYGENAPGALAEKTQALLWNRSNSKFCTPRAQWPGGNSDQPLRFYAPEGLHDVQGVTPVMGVQGVGEYGRGASILSPPLGGSLFSFGPATNKLAPQGEIPLRTTNAVRNPPPHPAPSGPPIPIPFGLRPSPLDKGSRPQGEGLKRGGEIPLQNT